MSATPPTRVLIVDDEEATRYILKRYLQPRGYQIWEASSGAEGIQIAESTPLDLAVLDVQLPDINGYELCRKIKTSPGLAALPVIQVSATFTSSQDRAVALEHGADACLTQPFEPRELLAQIESLLRVRRMEEVLRERDATLRLSVETAALGCYERNLQTNAIRMDERCRTILGVFDTAPAPDMAPRLLYPDDRERVLALVQRAFDPNLQEICGADFRIVRPDGQVRWVAGRGRVVFDQAITPPRPLKFIGVLQDITDRKSVEEALRESEQRLRLHVENTPMGVVEWDSQFRVTRWAGEAEAMFGWPATEALGKSIAELAIVYEPDVSIVESVLRRLTGLASRRITASNRNLTRDGRILYCTWYSSVLLDAEGKLTSVLSLILDDTARIQAEQKLTQARDELARANTELEARVQERTRSLEETTQQLNDFCYSIAHDLRAPIRAQAAFAHVLAQEFGQVLGETGCKYAQTIERAAERQGKLLSDLLAHISVGRSELPLAPLELVAVVEGVRAELETEIRAKQALVDCAGVSGIVLGNQASLHLALANLLSNALKFVPADRNPNVKVRTEFMAPYLRVWVEDNGIGIPEEYRDKLFGVFQRLHPEEKYPGTGIGLAIVKRALERMGGRAGFASATGKGSRFWVDLRPADTLQPSTPAQTPGERVHGPV